MTVILDGGLSNALEARGHTLGGDLWTARLLKDDPEEIAAVHRTYFDAGARVATTASYQASVPGLVAAGADRREAERLIRLSVRLAREVAAEAPGRLVAASVGPYAAVLGEAAEYGGYDETVTATTLRDFHAPRLELLAEEEPDLVAVETIPDLTEGELLAGLVREMGLKAWVSYAANGLMTRAGQPLKEAFAAVADAYAVGVNCCDPADARVAVDLAVATTGRPAVCYPNSGQWDGEASSCASEAPGWVAAGARYVGGCCQVGPEEIKALAASLSS